MQVLVNCSIHFVLSHDLKLPTDHISSAVLATEIKELNLVL